MKKKFENPELIIFLFNDGIATDDTDVIGNSGINGTGDDPDSVVEG